MLVVDVSLVGLAFCSTFASVVDVFLVRVAIFKSKLAHLRLFNFGQGQESINEGVA